jgi:hypothetical protein
MSKVPEFEIGKGKKFSTPILEQVVLSDITHTKPEKYF